jgi:transcriptional regulator with XRE-family HTH domain
MRRKATFPAILTALRESAKLTREDLASLSGLSRQAIHNYETGERSPTWEAVQALAKALGVATDTFRGG